MNLTLITWVKITWEHPRALNSPAQATISSQAGDRSVANTMVLNMDIYLQSFLNQARWRRTPGE